jgi:hypothetical protein
MYDNSINTRPSQISVAYHALIQAFSPKVAVIELSLESISGAGNAHSLRFDTRHFAHSVVVSAVLNVPSPLSHC